MVAEAEEVASPEEGEKPVEPEEPVPPVKQMEELELALLAIRNHVNDAILHAQLQGPQITAIVSNASDVASF